MKRFIALLSISILALGVINAQNQAADIATNDHSMGSILQLNPNLKIEQNRSSASTLYDNGSLINSPGTGLGGADESVLQNSSLGLNILGFGHQIVAGNWVADDFTVTGSGWDCTSFVFYAYQTGSTTTSTINDVRFMIYDGDPSLPGANVVWGDDATNRLTNTEWSGIYRVTETTSGASNRPIMVNTCDVNFHLDPGTYWLAWQAGGTLGSGPWAPPITITGQTTTGNALQSLDDQASYEFALDSGTNDPQGFPFLIYGAEVDVPISNWAIFISIFLIGLFAVYRFRRSLA